MAIPSAYTFVNIIFADKPANEHVLGVCHVHGSFVARPEQLNTPCPRCLEGRAPRRRVTSLECRKRWVTRYGTYVEDTAAYRLENMHNRAVLQTTMDIEAGIDAALMWCDESEAM